MLAAIGWACLVSASGGAEVDERIKPGKTFHLDFPDLGETWAKVPARLGIFIPEDYSPERTYPLLVWFGGGGGSDSPGPAIDIVGKSGFICVGIPYKPTGWETTWPYFETMLRELERVVPNINPRQRVCGGFSSGGAAISFLLGAKDQGFRKYFFAFMPGGAGWAMGDYSGLKDRPVYAFMGTEDTRLAGFGSLPAAAEAGGADVVYLKFEGGHSMPRKHFPEMREWLMQKVVHRDLGNLVTAMRSELRSERFGRAFRAATDLAASTNPEMPEHAEALAAIALAKPRGEAMGQTILTKPLAEQQQFVRDWKGSDFVAPVEAACAVVAEKQINQILSQQPVSTAFLRKYLEMWEGFEVADKAQEKFNVLAAEALAKIGEITSPESKSTALKRFIDEWSPSAAADEARKSREEVAAKELEIIKAIPAKGTMRSKLSTFIRTYEGTAAETAAKDLLNQR